MPTSGARDRFSSNLPRQLTSFVGRERELRDLTELVRIPRLYSFRRRLL